MDPGQNPRSPDDDAAPDEGVLTTSEAILRARNGDSRALSRVVAEMRPLLAAQARQRLGPRLAGRVDPEDLVQEAWCVALERLDDLRPRDGRLGPVLFRFLASTISNRANEHLRRAARDLSAEHAGTEARAHSSDAPIERPGELTQVLSRAIKAEDGDRLADLMAALSDDDQRIVVLRAVEGIPNAVAARLLGLAPNTLSQRYGRLLARLREALSPSILDELDAT